MVEQLSQLLFSQGTHPALALHGAREGRAVVPTALYKWLPLACPILVRPAERLVANEHPTRHKSVRRGPQSHLESRPNRVLNLTRPASDTSKRRFATTLPRCLVCP